MSSKILVSNTIRQCLGQIRKSKSLVELNLRVDPYMHNYSYLSDLQADLCQQQKQSESLLLLHKVSPPVQTCSVLPSIAMLANGLVGFTKINEEVVIYMQKCQDWVNDCIREFNEQQIEEKDVRSLLIHFRDSLEAYTEMQRVKQGEEGIYSKFVRFIL